MVFPLGGISAVGSAGSEASHLLRLFDREIHTVAGREEVQSEVPVEPPGILKGTGFKCVGRSLGIKPSEVRGLHGLGIAERCEVILQFSEEITVVRIEREGGGASELLRIHDLYLTISCLKIALEIIILKIRVNPTETLFRIFLG